MAYLLDFDGPVCDIFAGYPAARIATELRELATRLGQRLPHTEDPLQVLRNIRSVGTVDQIRTVAHALRDWEVFASESATLTPNADQLMASVKKSGRQVAIVSNNSTEAITSYLARAGLLDRVDIVIGRHDGLDPTLMKPNPYLLNEATAALTLGHGRCVMVGDSVSDIEAARDARIPVIGYVNKPGKAELLTAAGAEAVVGDMAEISSNIHSTILKLDSC